MQLGNYSRTLLKQLQGQFPSNKYVLFSSNLVNNARTSEYFDEESYQICKPESKSPLWRQYGIAKDIKSSEIEIYHGLSAELPKRLVTSCKYVVTIHDLIWRQFPNQYKAIDRIIYDAKAKWACNKAHKIVAISEQTKTDIIEAYGISQDKIDVIYQGCDDSFYTQASEASIKKAKKKYDLPANYVLFVGSLIERKNPLLLAKAADQLPKGVHVVLIGGGKSTYADEIHAIAESNAKVHLKTDVDFADFPALYQGAKAMVYPSIAEGFGIPIIEALASKIPVITSNKSCLPEAAGPSSMLLEDVTEQSLTDAINKVLTDDKLRDKMISDGLEHVKAFSNEEHARRMMELYKGLV